MKIIDCIFTKSYTGFYFDDQKAIKTKSLEKDGFLFKGEPVTPAFTTIRQQGEAISIQLVLDNGMSVTGDCAAVQYSGAAGRDELFLADKYIPFLEAHLKPLLIGETITTFKALAEKYDKLTINNKKLHTAIRYGITQALLKAVALKNNQSVVSVIQDEYNIKKEKLTEIPMFSQSGDDRYLNVDKMILKEVDSLPHALINNVSEKLGNNGEILLDYLVWLKNRILTIRLNPNYLPVLHIDVYGTIGVTFNGDLNKIVDYLLKLEKAVCPFKLRIEGPIDLNTQDATLNALKELTTLLNNKNSQVELVADEWCNTFEDVKLFADNKAGHVIQIKTPDLGGINNSIEAVLYCKNEKMGAYLGGTCNETNISAEMTVAIALATNADILLSKPAMDVDSGFMIMKNEMRRIIALENKNR